MTIALRTARSCRRAPRVESDAICRTVDRQHHGKGLGRALLRDVVLRTLQAAEIAGIRAILVHAKDEAARSFYERSGFLLSPIDPLTLKDARAALGGP
jgi:GNAT superfamily N-acetyltransferase